jgi:hypothetical protein
LLVFVNTKVKVKVKLILQKAMKAQGVGVVVVVEVYCFSLCLTSAVDGGGGWSAPLPGCLATGEKPKEAKWTPGPVWTGAKNFVLLLGFDPRIVQPVASRCTDFVISANGKYPVWRDMAPLL